MFRFRSCKNSEDICVDKSKNLSNITDIDLLDMQEKTKMGYVHFFLINGLYSANAAMKLETEVPK
jgi:hypothetical protein